MYGFISTPHRSEAAAQRAHDYSPAAIAMAGMAITITAGGNGSRGSRNGDKTRFFFAIKCIRLASSNRSGGSEASAMMIILLMIIIRQQ